MCLKRLFEVVDNDKTNVYDKDEHTDSLNVILEHCDDVYMDISRSDSNTGTDKDYDDRQVDVKDFFNGEFFVTTVMELG